MPLVYSPLRVSNVDISATLGDVFASAARYPSLLLTISKLAVVFSDRFDKERLCYSSAGEYLRYLQ